MNTLFPAGIFTTTNGTSTNYIYKWATTATDLISDYAPKKEAALIPKAPETSLEWLDRRVNEIRVAL